jgi:hypothetical protein
MSKVSQQELALEKTGTCSINQHLESDPIYMKRRILFFLSASMILLVLTALDLYALSNREKFRYGPALWAEKLSTEPEKYIVLTDPDPYLLEALSNPGSLGKQVFVGSWDNTNIDELIETHETNNVEYSKTYYTVTIASVDVFIYGQFLLILIFSWIILGLSFLVTYVRARKTQIPV